MSYPNIPLGKSDQERRTAQAVNYLLNETTYLQLRIDDGPLADGEVIFNDIFPVAFKLVKSSCYAKARTPAVTAVSFTISIGGAAAGSIAFTPGQAVGTVTLTETDLPALADFEITAPDPADTVLDDITLIIALTN